MEIKYILLLLLIGIYILNTIRAQIDIIKNEALDSKRRIINSILMWIIPFFWYFIINDLIKVDNENMTKEKRDKLLRYDENNNYRSGHARGY